MLNLIRRYPEVKYFLKGESSKETRGNDVGSPSTPLGIRGI